ncbi:endoglycoceramidase-like isoform X2 [Corticium candelabrum]|uniref:endoglycoceramidase-like isoform X2 n=1 Tax=Corticium candelabrum TaxID=121492 RepID=UPI002E25C37A|nr:endoglycoceramidase-like isoform X2 [Corticium candelabrum]
MSLSVFVLWLFIGKAHAFTTVDTQTKQFLDESGRARIFHGVNVVYKKAPYYPPLANFDPQLSFGDEDVKFLKEHGFTMVRLYVSWQGLETQKDKYNSTYLDIIESLVNKLGSNGIYSLLDCHQDVMSRKFCGEGFPDYAVLYHNRSKKSLPFPMLIPSLIPYEVDPKTGYPYPNECKKHPFFSYYLSDASCKAWQSLFENEQNIQHRFGLFWERVAQKFADNPYILGYELLNEPWCGDIYENLKQLDPAYTDLTFLAPMYEMLHTRIRKHDDKHIIFFEPVANGVTFLPVKEIAEGGFKQGPGGPAYNNRQVYSFHVYCPLLKIKEIDPTAVCHFLDQKTINIRLDDMKTMQTAGFVTEWGAYKNFEPNSTSSREANYLKTLYDSNLLSWTYWQYKRYNDVSTTQHGDEGFWDINGHLQETKVRTLSYPYATLLVTTSACHMMKAMGHSIWCTKQQLQFMSHR